MVTGKTYADYLQENIFSKAGLHNTYYMDTSKNIPNIPQGYSKFDGKLEKANLQNVNTIYASGAIMSNADDLFHWHGALYNNELIIPALLTKATTPYRFSDSTNSEYGSGWFIENLDGSKTIEHAGS